MMKMVDFLCKMYNMGEYKYKLNKLKAGRKEEKIILQVYPAVNWIMNKKINIKI